ncbi:hypothetical protein Tco_0915956, partial [Tanacetum coccineum]
YLNSNNSEQQELSHRHHSRIKFLLLQQAGRVRYMFALFWNINHAIRTLQCAAKNYHSMVEAEKKDAFPCTGEQIFDLLLSDGSSISGFEDVGKESGSRVDSMERTLSLGTRDTKGAENSMAASDAKVCLFYTSVRKQYSSLRDTWKNYIFERILIL